METMDNVAATGGTEPLGEAEIARLTDETVNILLDKQDLKTETEIWVRRGKVIREFVRKLQPGWKHKGHDPYALLASHPDIRWSTTQLRAYVAAVDLWEEIGEGQPSLPVSFYAIVASSELGFADKKALLAKAVAEHLSFRAVKGRLVESRDAAEGDVGGDNAGDASDREEQAPEGAADPDDGDGSEADADNADDADHGRVPEGATGTSAAQPADVWKKVEASAPEKK